MNSVLLLLAISILGVMLAVVINILASWFKRPGWMTNRRILLALAVLVVIAGALPVAQQAAIWPEPDGDKPQQDSGAPEKVPSLACNNNYVGDGAPRLVSNSSEATVTEIEDGYRVSFEDLTWAGLFLDIPPTTCDYVIELDARLLDTSSATGQPGWGYGIGVCNRWNGHQPSGFTLQYALFEQNGEAIDNSGYFAMPYVNNGQRIPLQVDGNVHHWIVELKDGKVTLSFDWGPPIGPFPVTQPPNGDSIERSLPEDCENSGAFLRVLGTTAEFTDITIRGIA